MKAEVKLWTSNHGTLISPCSTQQTLCEKQSGSFAVQSAPDFQTDSFCLIKRQPEKLRAFLAANLHLSNQKLCAKLGVQRIDNWLSTFGLKRTPEQRLAIAKEQNAGANNPEVTWLCRPHHIEADNLRRAA